MTNILPSSSSFFNNFSYSTQTKTKKRGGPGGLNKLCGVSPELQTIVGHPALPRTEVESSVVVLVFFSLTFLVSFFKKKINKLLPDGSRL